MQRKKIVHLISSLKIGGAESVLYDLIAGLGSEQYEHHVVYFHGGPNVERLRGLGIPVYHVRGLFVMYDPVFFWRAWRCIARLKPDVLHTALWAANFVGRIIGSVQKIPTVSVVHLGVDLDGKLRNFLDHATFNLSRQVVAVSDGVAATLTDRPSWVPAQKISVIKNGINGAAIVERGVRQAVSREQVGLTDQQVVFGAVGRFVPRKNFDLLIESFAQLHEQYPFARLMLVGLGPQELFLRQKALELGVADKVIFIVGQSAYGYYPLFDFFVLPSTQEGLSIALLEAMCFGLPCVVTSTQKTHEVIVDGQSGFVIRPNDCNALKDALCRLIEQTDQRSVMRENVYGILKTKFSFDEMVGAYRKIFENLMK